MILVEINEIPKARRTANNLSIVIKEFVNSGRRFSKIEIAENEYANPKSCGGSLHLAAKRLGYNHVKVHVLNGNVYLENSLLG